MPHDISHLPPSPVWVIPADPADPRPAVRDWLGHIAGSHESNTFVGSLAAGRIGNNPPPAPDVLARRLATEAQFAALAGSTRA